METGRYASTPSIIRSGTAPFSLSEFGSISISDLMGNKYNHHFNPFIFPSTLNSHFQLSLSSSSSSRSSPSGSPSPESYSNSYSCPSSPSFNSPFQSSYQSLSPPSDSQTSSSAAAFGPCAACKIHRRRCTDKCYLASYFPSDELDKFAVIDSLFGVSNIVKFLEQNSNSLSYVPLLLLLKDSRSQDHGGALLAAPQQQLSSSYGISDMALNPSNYNTVWVPPSPVQPTPKFTMKMQKMFFRKYFSAGGKENTSEGNKRRCEDTLEMVQKRPRHDQSVGSSGKVERFGDRLTALQKLVSPFGKADFASVLIETIGYIKFLQGQVQVLSNPYMKMIINDPHMENKGDVNLESRGLCLVPVSCTTSIL